MLLVQMTYYLLYISFDTHEVKSRLVIVEVGVFHDLKLNSYVQLKTRRFKCNKESNKNNHSCFFGLMQLITSWFKLLN
jgi:hypothetical protein